MTLPEFFLRYDDVRTQTLETFASALRDTVKKCVGDVTLSELSAASEYPNGLYFCWRRPKTEPLMRAVPTEN